MLRYELDILELITANITGNELLILPAGALSICLSGELLRLQACFLPEQDADALYFTAYICYHYRCILRNINLLQHCDSVYSTPLLQCFCQLRDSLESRYPGVLAPVDLE